MRLYHASDQSLKPGDVLVTGNEVVQMWHG